MKYFRNLLSLILALGLVGYLLWLSASGRLALYVAAGYFTFNLIVAAVWAFVLFVALVEKAWPKVAKKYLVICGLVLLVCVLAPAKPLSSVTANNRNLNIGANLNPSTEEISPLLERDTKTLRVVDWVKLRNYEANFTKYADKEVQVSGFLFNSRPANAEQGSTADSVYDSEDLLIGRFVVTCCAVDATPIGLEVKQSELLKNFKQDDWVQIKGKWEQVETNGETFLIINPSSVEAIPVPRNPYE